MRDHGALCRLALTEKHSDACVWFFTLKGLLWHIAVVLDFYSNAGPPRYPWFESRDLHHYPTLRR